MNSLCNVSQFVHGFYFCILQKKINKPLVNFAMYKDSLNATAGLSAVKESPVSSASSCALEIGVVANISSVAPTKL